MDQSKPITLTGVKDADFAAMEKKVADFAKSAPAIDEAAKQRLAHGEIVATWRTLDDGATEEHTIGVIGLSYDEFVKKLPPELWGRHLAGLVGGEVKPYGESKNGQQIERMVLAMPGADLDMTKIETVRKSAGEATVLWEVLKSDNGTVISDIGLVRFERHGEKTLVTFFSAHKLNKFPFLSAITPKPILDAVTGKMISATFKKHVEAYRKYVGA